MAAPDGFKSTSSHPVKWLAAIIHGERALGANVVRMHTVQQMIVGLLQANLSRPKYRQYILVLRP